MAKVIDITEKLSFEGNPALIINGKKIEVNDDAPTMLKIMNLVSGDVGAQEITKAYEMIFPEKSKNELEKMKLNFADFVIVVQSAVSLITGMENDNRGEQ